MNRLIQKVSMTVIWSLLALALTPTISNANESIFREHLKVIQQLDSDFQELSNEYLTQYSKQKPAKAYLNSMALYNAVKSGSDPIQNSNSIRSNIHLLIKTDSTEEFSFLLEHLYKNNDTATIRDITNSINKTKDLKKTSQNYFLLAKYYYERGNWQGLQAALSNVSSNELSLGDLQYYSLLMGYSLQESKMHRQSVSHYKSIPKTSPYFANAKLNEGIAYLRQGWWTEAHMEFEEAINSLQEKSKKKVSSASNNDLANRLLVVLGYSQIDNEFYRDARRTLRKVSLDSLYTNKAMMGLGIAAAHQKDFSGALNIFERLVQKKPRDENVDEAFLLVPYGYEELGDSVNASIKYQQAIQFYQARLLELNAASQKLANASNLLLIPTIEQLNLQSKELYDNANIVPSYFLANYNNILLMQRIDLSTKLSRSVNTLLSKYKEQYKLLTAQNIQVRTSTLSSYLSQAQFGVAKLYDHE